MSPHRLTPGKRPLFAASLALLSLSGCVAYRGGINGVVVDEATNEAIPGLEVYHYVKVRTKWPFQELPQSDLRIMRARRLGEYGDLSLEPNFVWLVPFVQHVEEERLILNLELRADIKERSVEDGVFTGFWRDPLYVNTPDSRYPGLIVDMRRSLLGPMRPAPPRLPYAPGQKFIYFSADQRLLERIALPPAVAAPPPSPEPEPSKPLSSVESSNAAPHSLQETPPIPVVPQLP